MDDDDKEKPKNSTSSPSTSNQDQNDENEIKIEDIYDGDLKDLDIPDKDQEEFCKKCKNNPKKKCKECGCAECGGKGNDIIIQYCYTL